MPSYSYRREPLPKAAAAPGAEAECYKRARWSLQPGTAQWQFSTGDIWSHQGVTTHFRSAYGAGIFVGGRRVKAAEGLRILGDRELASQYQQVLDATESDHTWYPIWRNAAFGMALGGLGMTLGGLGLLLADSEAEVTPLVLGGAAVAAASVIPTILASMTYKGAIKHDVYSEFFAEGAYRARLDANTARFNAQIQARCSQAR